MVASSAGLASIRARTASQALGVWIGITQPDHANHQLATPHEYSSVWTVIVSMDCNPFALVISLFTSPVGSIAQHHACVSLTQM